MHSLGLCQLVVLARAVTWFKHPNGPTDLRCEPVQGGCFALEVKHLLKPCMPCKSTGETPSYSNWIPGEPSHGKGDTAADRMRQGVCVAGIVWQSPEDHAVWPAFPGGWDDEDCD